MCVCVRVHVCFKLHVSVCGCVTLYLPLVLVCPINHQELGSACLDWAAASIYQLQVEKYLLLENLVNY